MRNTVSLDASVEKPAGEGGDESHPIGWGDRAGDNRHFIHKVVGRDSSRPQPVDYEYGLRESEGSAGLARVKLLAIPGRSD